MLNCPGCSIRYGASSVWIVLHRVEFSDCFPMNAQPMCLPEASGQDIGHHPSSRLSRVHSTKVENKTDSPMARPTAHTSGSSENSLSSPLRESYDPVQTVDRGNAEEADPSSADDLLADDDWQLVPAMTQKMPGRKSSSFSSDPTVTPQGIGVQVGVQIWTRSPTQVCGIRLFMRCCICSGAQCSHARSDLAASDGLVTRISLRDFAADNDRDGRRGRYHQSRHPSNISRESSLQ